MSLLLHQTERPSAPARAQAARGYSQAAYAASLAEFGRPRHLPRCDGWLLEREIPGSDRVDAVGCYPLFACRDGSALGRDLEECGGDWVSVCLVTDPLGDFREDDLAAWFPERCFPFKSHFGIDLSQPPESYVAAGHRRKARKALREVEVELCERPERLLDDWLRLYDVLIRRHGIRGIPAFSPAAFAAQLALPGLRAARAVHAGRTVGMLLWLLDGRAAHYHLGAYDETGYALGASFALFQASIEHFAAQGLLHLNLGAGAGLDPSQDDGLTRFKRGFANRTREAWFCGRILDRSAYARLAGEDDDGAGFFPAYRAGEFA